MTRQPKILPDNHPKAIDADERASRYLGDAREAEEAGHKDLAEWLYAKCDFWMDRFNRLTGRA
jgi:hypothetical protein